MHAVRRDRHAFDVGHFARVALFDRDHVSVRQTACRSSRSASRRRTEFRSRARPRRSCTSRSCSRRRRSRRRGPTRRSTFESCRRACNSRTRCPRSASSARRPASTPKRSSARPEGAGASRRRIRESSSPAGAPRGCSPARCQRRRSASAPALQCVSTESPSSISAAPFLRHALVDLNVLLGYPLRFRDDHVAQRVRVPASGLRRGPSAGRAPSRD